MKGRSIGSAKVSLQENIQKANTKSKDKISTLLFLDIKQAYENVDRYLLLGKLEALGLSERNRNNLIWLWSNIEVRYGN